MTHRIGTKGQVVIPKELREEAGLHPGAEVEFERDGERITITKNGVPVAVLVPLAPPRVLGDSIATCWRIARASLGERLSRLMGGPRLAR